MPFFVHSPASEKQKCGNVVLTWKKREKATPAFISNFATKQKKRIIPRSAFCLSTHFRFPSFSFFVFCVTEKFSVRTQSSLPQSSLHSPHTELCRRQLEATAAAAAHSPSESTPLFKKGVECLEGGGRLGGPRAAQQILCARARSSRYRQRWCLKAKLCRKKQHRHRLGSASSSVHRRYRTDMPP